MTPARPATRKSSHSALAFAFLLSLLAGTGKAQLPTPVAPAPAPAAPVSEAPPARPDAADLAAFVDGAVAAYRRRVGLAGVSVAVVDAQGPLLLRGYGFAGLDPERPVDEHSLFRIGSVSKTFTYLEALKLAEAGKLKLDAPANDYLPPELRLPEDGYAPALVRNLMTHTAGFEDSALGHLFAATPQASPSLKDYLQHHRPARVRAPGTHAVYSNYGVALLGAVLAQVEGVGFEALLERDLFHPLGMNDSGFREPLDAADPRSAPAALQALRSAGFARKDGGYEAKGFEYIAQIGPAGAVSSSATDMAKYLRMLLNRGRLDGREILPPGVFGRLENDPLVRNAPDATGFAHGFFRKRYGEVTSLEHGGATLYFHSNLVVLPDLGFGVFVSTNTDIGRQFAAELPGLLIERYFARARTPAAIPAPADFATTAQAYAGSYLGERRNYTTFEKMLISSNAVISVGKDHLVLSANGDASRWLPEKPDVFRAQRGPGRLVFLRDDSGKISGFVSPGGHDVYDRAGFLDQSQNLLLLLGLSVLSALGVLFGLWQRRRQPRRPGAAVASARWLGIAASAWLLFAGIFAIAFAQLAGDEALALFHYPTPLLRAALWLAVLALLLSLLCLPLLWPAWRSRDWNVWRKLRHTAAVAVFLATGWGLWVWNAVGWKL